MTEQSVPELLEFYRKGDPVDIAGWIERSIQAFKVAFTEFPAEVIRIELCYEAYPTGVTDGYSISEMQGKHTLGTAFTLGYAAGVIQSVDVVLAYEMVLNTLESMRFHYEITYGVMCPTGKIPHFIVKVPASPDGYVIVRFVPAVDLKLH
jgi:hypothetical protein